jgi:hypothetical protein
LHRRLRTRAAAARCRKLSFLSTFSADQPSLVIEFGRDDVIRLFPTESSFHIGLIFLGGNCAAFTLLRKELRAKRNIQEIPSQLGFLYRISSVVADRAEGE